MPTLKLLPTRSRSLLIELKFFSTPFIFLVDTGAESTAISYHLYKHIVSSSQKDESFYKAIREQQYHGCGGVETSQRVPLRINFLSKQLHSITIGHFMDEWIKNPYFYRGRSQEIQHGLLGMDVIQQFAQLTINFSSREISFL